MKNLQRLKMIGIIMASIGIALVGIGSIGLLFTEESIPWMKLFRIGLVVTMGGFLSILVYAEDQPNIRKDWWAIYNVGTWELLKMFFFKDLAQIFITRIMAFVCVTLTPLLPLVAILLDLKSSFNLLRILAIVSLLIGCGLLLLSRRGRHDFVDGLRVDRKNYEPKLKAYFKKTKWWKEYHMSTWKVLKLCFPKAIRPLLSWRIIAFCFLGITMIVPAFVIMMEKGNWIPWSLVLGTLSLISSIGIFLRMQHFKKQYVQMLRVEQDHYKRMLKLI